MKATRYMLWFCEHITLASQKMTQDEMTAFVARNVEPLTDKIYGNRYRVAAHSRDGTYLPCVVLQSKKAQVDLALRGFKELRLFVRS
jgi:hypothetical protein